MRSKNTALLLLGFLGPWGAHRFYTGKIVTGLLYLFTCGLFFVGVIVDFILICSNKYKDNHGWALKQDTKGHIELIVGVMLAAIIACCMLFNTEIAAGLSRLNSQLSRQSDELNTAFDNLEDALNNLGNNNFNINTNSINDTIEIEYTEVSINDMLNELSNNALRAEKTYQDKYIKFTGKIENIDSDGAYITVSEIDNEFPLFETIHCSVTDDTQLDVIINKNTGDTVNIKGQVTSVGEVIGYIIDIDEIN